MSTLQLRAFTRSEAERAARWTYEAPFDIYNNDPGDVELFLQRSDEGYGYYAIVDTGSEDDLVGFCCFGPEARVKGQSEEPGILDVGIGIRPDLVGCGVATQTFPSILAFGKAMFGPERFRTAVASFNERSIRLCRSAGFEVVREFDGPGRRFQEMIRPAR